MSAGVVREHSWKSWVFRCCLENGLDSMGVGERGAAFMHVMDGGEGQKDREIDVSTGLDWEVDRAQEACSPRLCPHQGMGDTLG